MTTKPDSEEEDAGKQSPCKTVDGEVPNSSTPRSYSRSLSHISENSADGIVLIDRSAGESGEVMSLASGISLNDIEMEMRGRSPETSSCADMDTDASPRSPCVVGEDRVDDATSQHPITKQHETFSSALASSSPQTEGVNPDTPSRKNIHARLECSTLPESGDVTYVARRVPVVEDVPAAGADCVSKEGDGPVDNGLENALGAVISSLDDYRGQFPELQLLEEELKLLQVTLKVRLVRNTLTFTFTE